MTAACNGGTSGPKFGQAAQVIYSSGLIAELLAIYDTLWLIPVIPLLAIPALTLAFFCQSDPPAMPTLTQAEVDALLNFTLGADFTSGLAKTRDAILHMTWYNSCECTSGSLVPLQPPVQPSGSVVVMQPVGQSTSNCGGADLRGTNMQPGATSSVCDAPLTSCPMPASASLMQITNTITVLNAPGFGVTHVVDQYNAANQLVREDSFHQPLSQLSFTQNLFPIATVTHYVYHLNADGGSGSINVDASLRVYCNGDTPGTQSACCPPDTATQSYLDSIFRLVSLIQRQAAPFSYVLGADHPGLTGNGVLNVSELLGMKLTPGTLPPDVGVAVGDPDTLWLDSWINWGNADGWTAREFLRSSPHLSLPAAAGQFTRLGYSLRPGLVVDATELVRGF